MTDIEYDLVVVGSGLAGLTAALTAHVHGLRVIVLEKSEFVGGASCWSYGALWVGNNDVSATVGVEDSRAAVMDYATHLGGGENNPERTEALIAQAPKTLRFLRELGIQFSLMPGVNDVLHGKAPGTVAQGRTFDPLPISGGRLGTWRKRLRTPPGDEWRVAKSVVARLPDPAAVAAVLGDAVASDQIAQGAGLVASLLCALRDRGVEILTGCAASRLLVLDGAVGGVASEDGRLFRASRAVLLATGNYLANIKLVAALDTLPGYRSWYPDTNSGDGLHLAGSIGAAVGIIRNNLAIMLGYDDPTDPGNTNVGAPSVRELPRAHVMVVNARGERFGNEGVFQELCLGLRAFDQRTRRPLNLPCWMVFDQHYAGKWGLAGSAPGTVPEWVMRADTLDALARVAGIDAEGLEATARRLSGFAESGHDADFGKRPGWAMTPGAGAGKNPSLGAIDTAPFYAVQLFPTLGVAGAGLRADPHARVLDWRGTPIQGLFAAGDVALHDEFGIGYQAGMTSASALSFAHRAVEFICNGV